MAAKYSLGFRRQERVIKVVWAVSHNIPEHNTFQWDFVETLWDLSVFIFLDFVDQVFQIGVRVANL